MPLKIKLPCGTSEYAVTMCRSPQGEFVEGSRACGTPNSVTLNVTCPHGFRSYGVFHTHPQGQPVPSEMDVREARRLGLHHMCVGVPETGEARCYKV